MISRQKIDMLAAELGATIDMRSDLGPRQAYADADLGYIAIPTAQDDWEQPLAMAHELGHMALHKGLDAGDFARRTEREADAWHWALDHAERTPTERERKRISTAIDSYRNSPFYGGFDGPSVAALKERLAA